MMLAERLVETSSRDDGERTARLTLSDASWDDVVMTGGGYWCAIMVMVMMSQCVKLPVNFMDI